MSRRILAVFALCLLTASGASAQIGGGGGMGGGMGGGGGRGGGGHGGGGRPGTQPSSSPTPTPASAPAKPVDASMIVGIVKAVDMSAGRVTIAYEPVEARNWPAGIMPFQAENPALLKDTKVGDKVRFRLESQQISEITPYVATSSHP